MRIILIVSLLVQQCLCSSPSAGNESSQEISNFIDLDECIDFGNTTHTVHMGWPFRFEISDVVTPAVIANSTLYRVYRKSSAKITLLNPDRTVRWNSTGMLKDIRYSYSSRFDILDSTPQSFVLVMEIPEINYCSKIKIHLQKERLFENTTCFLPEFKVTEAVVRYKETFHFPCPLSYGTYPKIFADPEDLEYEWWYNCSKNFPPNIKGLTTNQITITNADFYDGGRYTCAVKFMGQKRFLAPFDVCVRHGNSGTYTIKCQENVEGDERQELNITCVVDFGKGKAFDYHYRMQWLKLLGNGSFQEICAAQPYDGLLNSTDGDPRIQCENKKIEVPSKCYGYVPSLEQQIAPDRRFRLTMLIKDFRKSDAGRYLLNFTVFSNDFQSHTFAITLNKDPALIQQAVYIGIGVVVVLVLGSLLVLCLWKRREIRWFTKKHFGDYEESNIRAFNGGETENEREEANRLNRATNF